MRSRAELPQPSGEALAHSERLVQHIRSCIRAAGGWLDFSEYMDLALYAPGLGYYSAGAVKFGPAGDFVTAPEISPLFARCLARTCAPLIAAGDGVILELGAGSGALAAELIATLVRMGTPVRRYLILEVSAELRERQRATLRELTADAGGVVTWLDRLPSSPLRGVIIANEVADALPVSRFRMDGAGVLACGVSESAGGLGWAVRPAEGELAARVGAVAARIGLADGYESEICLRLGAWLRALAGAIDVGGALVLCDYGCSQREYYHPQRSSGTLVCHYRHRAHDDPFLYPGLQDITAWVDFSAVAAAAEAAGLEVAGYVTQAHFLLDAGIEAELAALHAQGGEAAVRAAGQARMLMLPGEMGERYKLMALTRGAQTPPGFGFRDLRHLL